LGVAEPEIALEGSNIAIQLPGVTKAREALDIIGTTAKLSFRPVLGFVAADSEQKGLPNCADPSTYPKDDPSQQIVLCVRDKSTPADQWVRMDLGPAELEGGDVSGARAQLGSQASGGPQGWSVELDLNSQGATKFEEVTGRLACNPAGDPKRQLAIVLDSVIESAPQIGEDIECNKGIDQGTAIITGTFSEEEARELALVLRFGALPIELEPATTTTVSPTLGRDSLRSGLLAGAIGLAVLLVYVMFFYRMLGLVVWVGLLIHAVFTMAVVTLLGQTVGFTLTLAGIAGLIISLGIATDSFIVYLERLKDEVRGGRTVRASVDRAWASSWRTILAADIVTAMAAVILYLIAVGGVRGFALMMGLSTALDIVISRYYMYPTVWLLGQTGAVNRSKALGARAVAASPQVSGGRS
jgi:protein-export membrane protein SecD